MSLCSRFIAENQKPFVSINRRDFRSVQLLGSVARGREKHFETSFVHDFVRLRLGGATTEKHIKPYLPYKLLSRKCRNDNNFMGVPRQTHISKKGCASESGGFFTFFGEFFHEKNFILSFFFTSTEYNFMIIFCLILRENSISHLFFLSFEFW